MNNKLQIYRMFINFPLDIKILIAYDIQTWVRLAFIDDEFNSYAYSPLGKR